MMDADISPSISGNSHGAIARVALLRKSAAMSSIGGPNSTARPIRVAPGSKVTERHSITRYAAANHAPMTATSRARDQRHTSPSSGTTGQTCISPRTATRFDENSPAPKANRCCSRAVLTEISSDSANSRALRTHAARRFPAAVTACAGGSSGGSSAASACVDDAARGTGALIIVRIAER